MISKGELVKYKQASIVLAFFVLSAFLSCTEQESASPQEIASAVELRAADIAEETPLPVIQQASIEGANAPVIYQVSAEEQAFTVFLEPIHYFEPLAADETLATLRTDSTTETAQKLFLHPILLRQTVLFSTVFNSFPTFFLKIN